MAPDRSAPGETGPASGNGPARGLAPFAVDLQRMCKSFGALRAVDAVDFRATAGSVVAIVGENGAGKSTLMKILAGIVRPDSGEMRAFGRQAEFASPREAALAGIGMVFQETALIPSLAVWENVVLGWEMGRWNGHLDRRTCIARVEALMERHGLHVAPLARVGALSAGTRQRVEILKVLFRDARIVIFDEPTSFLTPQERRALFDTIARLRASGVTVIFISHKLEEVLAVSEHVHVMRGGRMVADMRTAEANAGVLARLIVGKEIAPVAPRTPHASTTAVLRVEDVTARRPGMETGISGASLTVAQGEIIGLAGVQHSGQDELIAAIAGLLPIRSGRIEFRGRRDIAIAPGADGVAIARSLREHGLGYVPADRTGTASLAARPLWMSALAGRQRQPGFCAHGLMRIDAARAFAARIIKERAVRAAGPDAAASSLSGGNLQKFIVGRELLAGPALLVAEEPTHGVDIGSAAALRDAFRALADAGGAVLICSSELDELLAVCDRIVVLFEGRIAGDFPRNAIDEERLGAAMTGLAA